MKRIILTSTLILLAVYTFSQRYITKNGHIKFYSETPVETIEAHNHQVNSVLDSSTGDLVFKVLMKSFEFEKALMQEHFNENYVESDKFPNAIFKGKVLNIDEIDFATKGEYKARVEGDLTIHGVTNKIKEEGTLIIDGDQVKAKSAFIIKPADYQIKIPKTVINNIAEEIEVTVDLSLEAMAN
ncbi:MAG: YceI family protein [Bacteroidetes bacterium]|nr:YceI family protein [Bacteroidota bacterium]